MSDSGWRQHARTGVPPLIGLLAVVAAALVVAQSWPQPDTQPDRPDDRSVPLAPLACGSDGATGLTLSTESGFYDAPFELLVTATGLDPTIHYTLDGSTPDPVDNPESTYTYEGPISVDGSLGATSPISSIRTRVDDSTAPDGHAGAPTWDLAHPDGQTASVVRVRSDARRECVGVYFVGEELVRARLPVVHLTLDRDHLFGHETGIAVPGVTFEEYAASGEFDPDQPARHMPGNYTNRGRVWERPAPDDLGRPITMHFFEPGGALGYETRLGIRIHGGVTRERQQKSLRLYAREEYESGYFAYPFFGEEGPAEHRRLVLRNSGNDWSRTHLLDGFLHDVARDLVVDHQAYRPTVTFINGEYWGILNLRERYDRHYLSIHHGVDPDNVAIVEGDLTVGTGDESDVDDFRELLRFVASEDLSDPEAYSHVVQHLAIDDLIDYLAIQIFTSNTDWPGANTRVWRERVHPGGAVGPRDGRWRWVLYDLDHLGAHRRDATHDQFARLAEYADEPERFAGVPSLLDNLLDAPAFRSAFEQRFLELLDTSFHPDRTRPMLRDRADLIETEMSLHLERWLPGRRTVEDWRKFVDELERFLIDRPDILRHQLQDYLGSR